MEYAKNIKRLQSIVNALREYREYNTHILERNAALVISAPHTINLRAIILQDVHVVTHLKAIDVCLELLARAIATQRRMHSQMPWLDELEHSTICRTLQIDTELNESLSCQPSPPISPLANQVRRASDTRDLENTLHDLRLHVEEPRAAAGVKQHPEFLAKPLASQPLCHIDQA
jgi:hypothetical protein